MELLKASNVSMRFGGLLAVDSVDLDIDLGQVIGLIGPNGSGKTTFLNLLSCIYIPTEGQISFGGVPLAGLRPNKAFELGIARTFQNSRLFWNLNVLENVMVGMITHTHVPFWASALNLAGKRRTEDELKERAARIIETFSRGLYEQADKLARNLAYADRRRLEICRALAAQPRLLLLDEPSAGMDPAETEELMEDIARVKQLDPNLAMVIIEHDMAVIETLADRVVVFNQGRKIAEGPYQEVSTNHEVITAYLGGEVAC